MTRIRLRNLLIAVAVVALLLKDVEVRPYPAAMTSTTDWGGDLWWRGRLLASAEKSAAWRGLSRNEYRVTLGPYRANVEMTIRLGK